jgi:hypothetical protein
MKKIVLSICIMMLFNSCNEQKCDCNTLNTKLQVLSESISTLEKELEGYKNSPAKLYAQAKQYYSNKNKDSLCIMLSSITKYHPESNEYAGIKKMFEQLDKEEKERIVKEEKEKQERIAKEEAEKLKAVNKLKKKYDDVSNITWYYQPYFTHYNNANLLSVYIGKGSNNVWLRLKMSYTGDDWIFFENAYLSYDGNTIEIPFDKYENKETDNSGGAVWEWIDISVSSSLLNYLKTYTQAKEPKMRLSGKYTKTRTLSSKEISGLKDVLLAYDVLTSK